MQRLSKVKISSAARPAHRKATGSVAPSPRAFPAWIDDAEPGFVFTAVAVTPRVRDALVLRSVELPKPAARTSGHGPGAR